MSKKEVQESVAPMSDAELVAGLVMLAELDRAAYRRIRAVMWEFFVENSQRSDFPSDFS